MNKAAAMGSFVGRPPVPLEVRFTRQYIPEPMSGCFLWMGSVDGRGYGSIKDSQRVTRRASRVSWQLTHGPIPKGMCVCHRCDNPLCVNPDHLFIGSNADNTRDMLQKGRAHDRRGNNAKLTPEQVQAVRLSSETPTKLAERYSISTSTVWLVKTKRRWAHI